MGNLICTGVDVSFPDDTLSFGDFPTTIKAVVKLKPALPRDRAGIEMMFNHGRKRIYMPAGVKVDRTSQINSTRRGLWDKYVVDEMEYAEDWVKKEVTENGKKVIKWVKKKNNALLFLESAGFAQSFCYYILCKTILLYIKLHT
ncbi:MAG: hypothetical protein LBI45_03310 [Bacteroidales bacterium]|nr:hypothetical protein [Bacteroidales bacterium]